MKSTVNGLVKIVRNGLDKQIVFLALGMLLTFSYYMNPLNNVDVTEWNRTFCTAVLSGISIDRRIGNFYLLFLIYFPVVFMFLMLSLSYLFKHRSKYKDFYAKYCILTVATSIASLISRYSSDGYEVVDNPLMQIIIGFWILLVIITLIDKDESFDFSDIVLLFLTYVNITLLFFMFFGFKNQNGKIILSCLVVGIASGLLLKSKLFKKHNLFIKNFLYLMMWMPASMRLELEGIYFLTEKGRRIQRYFTLISWASVVLVIFFVLLSYFAYRTKKDISSIGYIGFMISISALAFFAYAYQYTWSFGNYANIYELGNSAVAADSILYGKLPIIDYFSAHAIGDVWTQIIYCLVYGDINGALVNPYGGITNLLALIICYYIAKNLFDREIAVLYVALFPGLTTSIKWTSVCCLSIVMLIYIYKKNSVPRYILFWISVLLCAFFTYDEGISLGVACILSYLVIGIINKKWRELSRFGCCGAGVGFSTLLIYMGYGLTTGIPIISRIKEWLSVSLGSSSSWATSSFGDQTSFAFFVSYFVVPVIAILLLIFVLLKYIKNRSYEMLVILTVAFSLAETLYITRTIVYHNLAVCSGWTGVLLNFIHWTVSLYVLFVLYEKGKSYNIRLLGWLAAMMIVIVIEGTAVTNYWPNANSTVLYKAAVSSETWELSDDVTDNIGKKRIVYDESSQVLVNQYKELFDTLLTEEQTFLDFANITSMYMLTDRKRPCYVGQSPSLLTDLYSQECFLSQVEEYDCPLAVVGTTGTPYLAQMIYIPHNVRYYKIAEYIYENYRPLVGFGEVAIWCKQDFYEQYRKVLEQNQFSEKGYSLIDYGYDFTAVTTDENGNTQYVFRPFHSYDLNMIPYLWANFDNYNASNNEELVAISASDINTYHFAGSQTIDHSKGNYLSFEYTNTSDGDVNVNIVFYDSANDGAKIEYYFRVIPGTNKYLIRVSADYFWDVFNVDTILFSINDSLSIGDLKILKGD